MKAVAKESSRQSTLFVGNSRENCDAVQRTFAGVGFDVFTASSYREALTFISQRRIDLVLCEQHLVDGAWVDLLSRFAAMNEAPDLVVIFDPNNPLATWAEAINLGAHDVLVTPLLEEPLERVACYVREKAHRRISTPSLASG